MRRLHDLERGRQLAFKLGHRRAPSLECPLSLWADRSCDRFSRRRAGLCKDVLSVIVIILPSEKSRRSPRRLRKRPKSAALIDLGTCRYINSTTRYRQEADTFN